MKDHDPTALHPDPRTLHHCTLPAEAVTIPNHPSLSISLSGLSISGSACEYALRVRDTHWCIASHRGHFFSASAEMDRTAHKSNKKASHLRRDCKAARQKRGNTLNSLHVEHSHATTYSSQRHSTHESSFQHLHAYPFRYGRLRYGRPRTLAPASSGIGQGIGSDFPRNVEEKKKET